MTKQYYLINPEVKDMSKKWIDANTERKQQTGIEYREKNKKKHQEHTR